MSPTDLTGTAPTQVEALLLDLGTQAATGSLTLTHADGDEAVIWFREGRIYSVSAPGRRALLGARLMSSGAIAPEALGEALEIQRTELQGWRLGELLVHLGYVEQEVVESFVAEQLRDMLDDLIDWPIASEKFRNGKKTRQDVAKPSEVVELLEVTRSRRRRWAHMLAVVGDVDAVPSLSSGAAADSVELDPHDWAMLCKIDGHRSVTDLADECGFTLLEAGEFVASLVGAGLVEMDGEPGSLSDFTGSPADEAPQGVVVELALRRAATAVKAADDAESAADTAVKQVEDAPAAVEAADETDQAATADESLETSDDEPEELVAPTVDADADGDGDAESDSDADLARSVASVTAALEGLFADEVPASAPNPEVVAADGVEPVTEASAADDVPGDVEPSHDVHDDVIDEPIVDEPIDNEQTADEVVAESAADTSPEPETEVAEVAAPAAKAPATDLAALIAKQAQEAARRRTAERAERLAAAEAAERLAQEEKRRAEEEARRLAEEAERLAAELAARKAEEELQLRIAEQRATEAAERAAVEDQAWGDHALHLAAERASVEVVAWAEHVIHLDRERALVEAEAWVVHRAYLEGEREGAEPFAWADHGRWLNDQRALVEPDAWTEHHDRLIIERDGVSDEAWAAHAVWQAAERVAAEGPAWDDHAEWLAAERAAAEEAARVEAARAEEARVEAERVAAEEAQRAVAERAARDQAAAEEAARIEAERLEAERVTAEQAAAERAARDQAAAEEAARIEAERQEAERVAADEAAAIEAEWVATEAAIRAEQERAAAAELAAMAAEALSVPPAEPEPVIEHTSTVVEVLDPTPQLRSEMAAMLTELNREAAELAPNEPIAEPAAEPIVEQVAAREPSWSDLPSGGSSNGTKATATETSIDSIALMRELTSLSGLYDEAPDAGDDGKPKPAPVVTRPVNQPSADKQKKKRGLFGF